MEDRDRVNGVYFVRYVDPDAVGTTGFLKKLFTFGAAADKEKEAQRYQVAVKAAPGAATSNVTVMSNDGKPETDCHRRQDLASAGRRAEISRVLVFPIKAGLRACFFYAALQSV